MNHTAIFSIRYLLYEIDTVVHPAALVNLIYPYQAFHGPNVLGTQNVILFACSNKIKPLHYIRCRYDDVDDHDDVDNVDDEHDNNF